MVHPWTSLCLRQVVSTPQLMVHPWSALRGMCPVGEPVEGWTAFQLYSGGGPVPAAGCTLWLEKGMILSGSEYSPHS